MSTSYGVRFFDLAYRSETLFHCCPNSRSWSRTSRSDDVRRVNS